jgi:hypothetical protein
VVVNHPKQVRAFYRAIPPTVLAHSAPGRPAARHWPSDDPGRTIRLRELPPRGPVAFRARLSSPAPGEDDRPGRAGRGDASMTRRFVVP